MCCEGRSVAEGGRGTGRDNEGHVCEGFRPGGVRGVPTRL